MGAQVGTSLSFSDSDAGLFLDLRQAEGVDRGAPGGDRQPLPGGEHGQAHLHEENERNLVQPLSADDHDQVKYQRIWC